MDSDFLNYRQSLSNYSGFGGQITALKDKIYQERIGSLEKAKSAITKEEAIRSANDKEETGYLGAGSGVLSTISSAVGFKRLGGKIMKGLKDKKGDLGEDFSFEGEGSEDALSGLRSKATDALSGLKQKAGDFANKIKGQAESKMNELKSGAQNKFEDMKGNLGELGTGETSNVETGVGSKVMPVSSKVRRPRGSEAPEEQAPSESAGGGGGAKGVDEVPDDYSYRTYDPTLDPVRDLAKEDKMNVMDNIYGTNKANDYADKYDDQGNLKDEFNTQNNEPTGGDQAGLEDFPDAPADGVVDDPAAEFGGTQPEGIEGITTDADFGVPGIDTAGESLAEGVGEGVAEAGAEVAGLETAGAALDAIPIVGDVIGGILGIAGAVVGAVSAGQSAMDQDKITDLSSQEHTIKKSIMTQGGFGSSAMVGSVMSSTAGMPSNSGTF